METITLDFSRVEPYDLQDLPKHNKQRMLITSCPFCGRSYYGIDQTQSNKVSDVHYTDKKATYVSERYTCNRCNNTAKGAEMASERLDVTVGVFIETKNKKGLKRIYQNTRYWDSGRIRHMFKQWGCLDELKNQS